MLTFPLHFFLHSDGASDTDSEVEDRVDGVKSWLSKNKGSAKNLSDDGSLKSSRSVPQPHSSVSRYRMVSINPNVGECNKVFG